MADTKQLTTMLQQLGWGSGFRLPIANEENRKLEEMLEMKQTLMVSLSNEVQDESLAVYSLTSNLKHLNSIMKHAKDLEIVKRGHMDKEKHISSLAERSLAKTEQDVKNAEKRLRAMKDRNKLIEGNVLRRKDTLAELVEIINFDKKAITEYEQKLNKEDAYMKLIDDFADTDSEKIKKCQSEYQTLGETIANSRRHLDLTISETEIMDSELDSLAKRFRKAHSERNQFIDNWQGTLKALEGRDQEIMNMSNEYQRSALEMKKTRGMLERQEAFYDNIQNQTRSYGFELNRMERKMNMMSTSKRQTESVLQDVSDAVSDLGVYIVQIDKEVADVRNKLEDLTDGVSEYEDKMRIVQAEIGELKGQYDIVTKQQLTSSEHSKQLEEFLEKELKQGDLLAKELEKQTTYKSQRETQTNELKDNVALAESEINNLKAGILAVRKESDGKNAIIIKIQAVAYRLDLKAMECIARITALENPESLYSVEEFANMQTNLAKLKQKYEEMVKTQTLIRYQTTHCEHVTVICQKELKREDEENRRFEINLQTLQMEIRRIGKEEDHFVEMIMETGVTNSLLQVQLRKMLHSLKHYETKMFDLEQERVTLQVIVKARKKDIETYTTLLNSKKRGIQDEVINLKAKCLQLSNESTSKKRRYEMIMMQMWKGDEAPAPESKSEGGGRSEAYFIIKLAQEREFYRQEGDQWDERVKEAEKIVEGLQNTLALMMGTNETFKDSLKPATANTKEGQQLQELKQRELESAYNLKVTKEKRSLYACKLEKKQSELDNVISLRIELEHDLMEKRYEVQSLMMELNGQKDKIRRASLQANKVVKELSKIETLDAELLKVDLRLRVTKEKYEFGIATLERLLNVYPELLGDTLEFLNAKGMTHLSNKLAQKMASPSHTASPFQSGRSTPHSTRSSTGSGRSKHSSIPRKQSVRISSAKSTESQQLMGSQSQIFGVESSSIRRSVVFEPPTSKSSAQRLLKNISKGINAHKVQEKLKTRAQTQSGTGGINFGELRKALKDAVTDQQTQSQLYKVVEEPELEENQVQATDGTGKEVLKTSSRVSDPTDVVELVDKKKEFEDAMLEDDD